MLDLGLTKMAVIGVVALVVLGPERLPGVARTAGALFGRAQRYINDVKSEVAREMELDELKKMRTEFETAASNVESTIHDTLRRHESELNDAWKAGHVGRTEHCGQRGRIVGQRRVGQALGKHVFIDVDQAQELAREAGRDSQLVQAHDFASHAGPIGRGARRSSYARHPAPADEVLLSEPRFLHR